MYVQLIWEDPATGEIHEPIFSPPIAIGREKDDLPETLGEQSVQRLELIHKQISRFHALITVANEQMYITDKSSNGTFLNGRRIPKGSQLFSSKDTLRIGPYKITATLIANDEVNSTELVRDSINPIANNPIFGKNSLLIWLIGSLLLLVMSAGVWFFVQAALDNLRPQTPINSDVN